MASPEPTTLTNYLYRVSRLDPQHQARQKIKPTDYFELHIDIMLGSHSADSNTITTQSTLFRSFQHIGCKSFFQEAGQDFLRSNLSHPLLPPRLLNHLIPTVMPEIQQMFELDESLASDLDQCSDEVFPLFLEIITVDVPNDIDSELAVVLEESMQEVRMIPASKKAIDELLKKIKLKERIEQCNICMEEFDVGDDDVSAMPCNHVFHQECIVRWLQTSHMCPLCRYPLPTADI